MGNDDSLQRRPIVMTQDSLSSSETREISYLRFLNGVKIVQSILGLALKSDVPGSSASELITDSRMRNPDAFFTKLFSLVYSEQKPIHPQSIDFDSLHNSAFSPSDWILGDLIARIGELHALSDQSLVEAVTSQFEVSSQLLEAPGDRDCFTYLKINHGFWEHLAKLYFAHSGIPYYRPIGLDSRARYYAPGFVSLLSRMLREKVVFDEHAKCHSFSRSDFELGISFNSGDFPYGRDLQQPIGLAQRGAMIGSLAYFKTIIGPQRLVFGDGAGPKQLVYQGRLGPFVAHLSNMSDCVVFIVPRHLRNIELTEQRVRTLNIVIPGVFVHELWPVVLPYVAGTMADALREFRNITVFIQAGAMSAPIGILIDKMRRQMDDAGPRRLNCFDLGQVLDLAIPPGQKSGGWSQRVREHEHNAPFVARPIRGTRAQTVTSRAAECR